jgi:uncharacterized protein (DUF2141 family)
VTHFLPLAALALLAQVSGAGAEPAMGAITVAISGIRSDKGNVHVDICPEANFLGDCPYSVTVPARKGMVSVVVRGVPPGRYAVQAFHDANGNGEVDRGLFGIPKEGLGFSNDAMKILKRPKFAVAAFDHAAAAQTIPVLLHYFLG